MLKYLFAGLAVLAVCCSCLKSSQGSYTVSCNYDPCSVVAPDSEITAVRNYLSTNNIAATQHCSGLFYKVDTLGNGAAPTPCSNVIIRYKGYLANGKVFDSSSNDVVYPLLSLIRGWTNGLPYVQTGGLIHLYIPPALGYGYTDRRDATGNVIIPANSIIIFDVHLDGVQ